MRKFLFTAVFNDTKKMPAVVLFDADIPDEVIKSIYHRRMSLVARLCERFKLSDVNHAMCSVVPVGDITIKLGTPFTFDGYPKPAVEGFVVGEIQTPVHEGVTTH